jgi:hypothetical protein
VYQALPPLILTGVQWPSLAIIACTCGGEPGDEAREKCPHVIASHVHEQYRECGNLQTVILEVKVVMNESLEM